MNKHNEKELPSVYQKIIHLSRYSRYREDVKRRETWEETVDRLINYLQDKCSDRVASCLDEQPPYEELREAILNLEVVPSMRLLMSAGIAIS